MPILLIVLLAVVAEFTVVVTVGGLLGVLPTILLLVAGTVLGGALLRREGRKTLAALQESVRLRRPPRKELVDGVLIAAAGVLVFLPGFISDVLGFLLLLPPTRAMVRGWALRRADRAGTRPFVVDSQVAEPQVVDLGVVDPRVVDSVVVESGEARRDEPRVIVIPPRQGE